jgi:hypothetical protein
MGDSFSVVALFGRQRLPITISVLGDSWRLDYSYHKGLVEEVKAMKGAKWNPDEKFWTVDICRRNAFALAVLGCAPSYLRYTVPQEKVMPNTEVPMWAHQLDVYQFIRTRKRCLVGAEPRTGKTRPTLQAIKDSSSKLTWFVTTKSAELGILREVDKWFKGQFNVVRTEWNVPTTIQTIRLMTYDGFSSMMAKLPNDAQVPQFVVFDECHKLKTPTAARTEQALRLGEMMDVTHGDDGYIVGLSGTPSPKDPSDWWAPCEVIRCGFIREGTIAKFRKRYGVYKPWDNGATPAWERFQGWDMQEVGKLSERLSGLVKVYFQKDCLDIPPIRFELAILPPSTEILRVAKMIVETEDNPLRARNRLRQLSDGFEYTKEYNNETNEMERTGSDFVGSPKIEQLEADLEEYEEVGRIVVYAAYQGAVDIVRETALKAGWSVLQLDGRGRYLYLNQSVPPVADEQSILLALGEMDRSTDTNTIRRLAVVAQSDSAGTGLEFSSSPITIYYSNSDNGEGRMQSEQRGHSANMDKVRGCTVKDYIHLPTDQLILDRLRKKKDVQALSMGDLNACLYLGAVS